jgi:hypothetical protein
VEKRGEDIGMEGDFLEDIGEGAFYSDEENRRPNEEPFPDEVWDEELRDIDEEVI